MKESAQDGSSSPLDAARKHAARPRQKRFYERAEAVAGDGGFALHLDGRPALTPGRNRLAVADAALAAAIVKEWAGQGVDIDPASMPATRLANSAIDGVATRMDEVRREVLAYAGTDLLHYRAGEPERLVSRQREVWDPIVTWAERQFSGRFILAEGITHVTQPQRMLDAVARELATFTDPLRLAGLHVATTLTGSALLALALARGELSVEGAWSAAHVDEDFNIATWGEDAEAARARARRFEDFRAAALALGQAA